MPMLRRLLCLAAVVVLSAASPAGGGASLAAQPHPGGAEPTRADCMGDPEAPIVLEVFSDLQCPTCRTYFLNVTTPLLHEYVSNGSLCVIYRDLPLSIHQHARQAALYATAAGSAGIWLDTTAVLYLFQDEWAKDGNIEAVLARELPKKAMAQIRRALKDPKLAPQLNTRIDRDIERARRLAITGTPTWFITANGKTEKFTGAVQYQILKRYLDQLLGK